MIGIYELSTEDYKKECHSKIRILEELISYAKGKAIGSKAREEYANLIAVVLRTLTCRVSRVDCLIKQCGYDEMLLFPLYSPIEACNLLISYHLVGEIHNNNQTALVVRDDLKNEEIVYSTYLSFKSWLFEAVVDFKDADYPPLSRYEIIRLIADQRGAHFQPDLDGRLYKIIHEPIIPVLFEGKYSSDNLFTETIIGIADELCFSYYHSIDSNPQIIKEEDFVFIQEFKNNPNNTYKYVRSRIKINAYNSNMHYDCSITEEKGKIYRIQFRERLFDVAIIKI